MFAENSSVFSIINLENEKRRRKTTNIILENRLEWNTSPILIKRTKFIIKYTINFS